MASICSAVVLGAVLAPAALAQSNPFVPPQSGMTKTQIEQIVRQEIDRSRAQQGDKGSPATPGVANAPGGVQSQMKGATDALPAQKGGAPGAASRSAQADGTASPADDPVAELLKSGGIFVGCVSGTPVFKDKIGRRAYFTTKELRESHEARRFARCS